MIRDVIILADIFEEEDFYPSTFGFRLSPPIEDGSLTGLLDLATGAIEERVSLMVYRALVRWTRRFVQIARNLWGDSRPKGP